MDWRAPRRWCQFALKTDVNAFDDRLLVALQKGLPLETRPFASIGRELGLNEEVVLTCVRVLFETGVARRFGAVFDSRSLGYESTLCAADMPAADLVSAVSRIVSHPGITHCYEREGHPNLWFTLTAPAMEITQELKCISSKLGAVEMLNLPAVRKFKIETVFGQGERAEHAATEAGRPPEHSTAVTSREGRAFSTSLTERERRVVRRLQDNIAVTEDPFGTLAQELGYTPAELLALLQHWQHHGIIRRIGLVLRHRQMGLVANSMCVWGVTPDRVEAAGASLAKSPQITHCYERPSRAAFPYNLYAMIHAKSRENAIAIFHQLGCDAGLADGRMLWSLREFKKSSPVFFCERTAVLFATPGTSCASAMRVYEEISRAAKLRFPEIETRWTFTSAPVRRKFSEQGFAALDPRDALAALQTDGFMRVVVMPLHLSDGLEFSELKQTVADWTNTAATARRPPVQISPATIMQVGIGQALLADENSWRLMLKIFCSEIRALEKPTSGSTAMADAERLASSRTEDIERIILVAHGSEDLKGRQTIQRASEICRDVDPRLILGALLGRPDLADVIRECKAAGTTKVWLLPCMLVAGYSVQQEIAGAGESSWDSTLRRAGFEVVPVVKGLGEITRIVQVWLGAVEQMLGELPKQGTAE